MFRAMDSIILGLAVLLVSAGFFVAGGYLVAAETATVPYSSSTGNLGPVSSGWAGDDPCPFERLVIREPSDGAV